MPVRKKSRPTHKIKSPIIVVYKYIIVSLIIVLAGATLADVFTVALSGTRVLGAKTLLARGGDDSGGSSDSGSSGSDSNNSNDSGSNSNSGSSGNSGSGGSGIENNQVSLEVKTAEGDRLKVRTEDNRTKVEIRTGGVKTKIESRDETIVKQEKESELENEFEDETGDDVRVATDGGSFDMPGKHLGAISHFPISIDLATNALIITTPAGTKTVAILPDVAVQNMISKGIISKIGGHVISASGSAEPGDDNASGSGNLENGGVAENIELTEENGTPVYKINGQKEKRFFGLIPVTIDKTVTVSADTGKIESTQLSPFERFLDLLSL